MVQPSFCALAIKDNGAAQAGQQGGKGKAHRR